MRGLVLALAAILLLSLWVAPVYGEEEVRRTEFHAYVDKEGIQVHLTIRNINTTIYERIKQHGGIITEYTIPETIVNHLKEDGYKRVSYRDPSITLDDESRSIHASFYLTGLDVISYGFNFTSATKVYKVLTKWRLYDIEFRDGWMLILKLNFSRYYRRPVALWEKIDYVEGGVVRKAYFLNNTEEWELNPICYIVLPANISRTWVEIDTIYFEYPATPWHKTLSTPLWVITALIIIDVVVLFKRRYGWKVRGGGLTGKGKTQPATARASL